jgi:hypothetical protein
VTVNPHLKVLLAELQAAAAVGAEDGYTLYLQALVEIDR